MNEDAYEQAMNLQLESGEFIINEADKLIKRYYSLKTKKARKKMELSLRAMAGKLQSQKKEVNQILGED